MQSQNKRMGYSAQFMAQRLRRARMAKGLSQKALSAEAGIAAGRISRFENGHTDLSVESVIPLARTLELEPMLVPRTWIPAVRALINRGPGALKEPRHQPDWGIDDDDGPSGD